MLKSGSRSCPCPRVQTGFWSICSGFLYANTHQLASTLPAPPQSSILIRKVHCAPRSAPRLLRLIRDLRVFEAHGLPPLGVPLATEHLPVFCCWKQSAFHMTKSSLNMWASVSAAWSSGCGVGGQGCLGERSCDVADTARVVSLSPTESIGFNLHLSNYK